MPNPVAVLISDVHFTVPTLELASTALLRAQFKARCLRVPLVIAGDLLDSKAVIRAECANRLITLLSVTDAPDTIILVGNHDKINEKSESHALNFLKPYATVIEHPEIGELGDFPVLLIPYQHDTEALHAILDKTDINPDTIIMHQGVQTAHMGHYVQDKTSLPQESFANYRVISGHYHRRQDIKCGRPRKGAVGLFSYIGNPYSLSFGESEDGDKGYQILMDDGTLEFISTNLPRHRVYDRTIETLFDEVDVSPEDKVWIKVRGTKSQLDSINKQYIGSKLLGHQNFKLDKIALDSDSVTIDSNVCSQEQLMDQVIDQMIETDDRKSYLKGLWRSLL